MAIATPVKNDSVAAQKYTVVAKVSKPTLPHPAPSTSRAAACLPLTVPRTPLSRLRWRSCFSIRDALAQMIAGKAGNSPPVSGPNASAIIPARTVAAPPNAKRTAYSYQVLSLRADHWKRTTKTLLHEDLLEPQREGKPDAQRDARCRRSRPLSAHHQLEDHKTVQSEGEGADLHRAGFQRNVVATVLPISETKRRQCNRRRRAEQPGKALGSQHITQDGKQGNDETTCKKA